VPTAPTLAMTEGTRPPVPISDVVTDTPRRPVRGHRPMAVKVWVSVPRSSLMFFRISES